MPPSRPAFGKQPEWARKSCAGCFQSPVDIVPEECLEDETLKTIPLQLNYQVGGVGVGAYLKNGLFIDSLIENTTNAVDKIKHGMHIEYEFGKAVGKQLNRLYGFFGKAEEEQQQIGQVDKEQGQSGRGMCQNILNTGNGWQVNMQGADLTLEGGPLNYKYKLEQFHCHWGCTRLEGSEHTINGSTFPAEIHFVHWNCDRYTSFTEAVDKPDGLAVVGMFFEIGSGHSELGKLAEVLDKIPYKGDTCEMESSISAAKFLPDNKSYWTYHGSLTIPPYLESVTWIIFKECLEISEEQINVFRNLYNHGREENCNDEFGGKTVQNFRKTLPLGDRVVRSCSLK